MTKKFKILFLLAPLIVALDHLTKWLIVKNMAYGDRKVVIEWFFDLVYYKNKGAAFGFLAGWDSLYRDIFFFGLAVVALVFLYFYLKSLSDSQTSEAIPISLIVGGALGNLLDRLFRDGVVDFLSVHWNNKVLELDLWGYYLRLDLVWPAFNVADSAITVGVVWLLIATMKKSPQEQKASS